MSWIESMLIFCLAVKLFYLFYFFIPLYRNKSSVLANHSVPITVLICARNEADQLERCLQDIFQQQYPAFEVLVVNHQSTDNTQALLEKLQKLHPQLRSIHIERGDSPYIGKRQALYHGIEAAKHAIILTTDADCSIPSPLWIQSMANGLSNPKKEIVLGFGPLKTGDESILSHVVYVETLLTAQLYLSFALRKMPYMAVGRNMAFKKSLVDGAYWKKYAAFGSGDDDLIVQNYSTEENTSVVYTPESQVWSEGASSWRAWLDQKTRHLSVGKYYSKKILTLLGIFHLTGFLTFFILFLGFTCGFSNFGIIFIAIMVLTTELTQLIFIQHALRYPKSVWKSLLILLLIPSWYIIGPIYSLFCNNEIWRKN